MQFCYKVFTHWVIFSFGFLYTFIFYILLMFGFKNTSDDIMWLRFQGRYEVKDKDSTFWFINSLCLPMKIYNLHCTSEIDIHTHT